MMAELEKSACIELMIVQYLRATEFRRAAISKKRRGIVRSNDQKSMSINELKMLSEEVAIKKEKKYCRKKSTSRNGCGSFKGRTTYRALVGRAALPGSGVLTLDIPTKH